MATGRGPLGLAIDQVGERLYVAASGDDEVEIIDVRAGRIINKVKLNNGDSPQELALTPDKRLLLATDKGSNTVSVIDTSSMIEQSRIPVGQGPVSIIMDSAGRRAYVFNSISNTISVIDVANSAVAATIATDSSPIRGQFNPAGDKLYVIRVRVPVSHGFRRRLSFSHQQDFRGPWAVRHKGGPEHGPHLCSQEEREQDYSSWTRSC